MPSSPLAGTIVIALAAGATAALAQAPAPAPLVGGWTLNKDLSDQATPDRARGDGTDDGNRGRRDGGFGGGGRRRGGFGGGGFGGGQGVQDREAAERMRNALRDELQAPDHLIIVSSEKTIIITAGDGRTTRLSPDGKKIKDESTNVERRTKWDGGKLVSEISGLGPGKITETYSVSVDAEQRQLRVAIVIDGPRKSTVNRVYDADSR